jgi:hypothetical protein
MNTHFRALQSVHDNCGLNLCLLALIGSFALAIAFWLLGSACGASIGDDEEVISMFRDYFNCGD